MATGSLNALLLLGRAVFLTAMIVFAAALLYMLRRSGAGDGGA